MKTKSANVSIPQVMGILNITPNSFSAVGRYQSVDAALRHAAQLVTEGAAIIDVGGEPTNPGVFPVVSLQEELDRVLPVVEALVRELPVTISVDTSKAEVMREVIARGVGFINDVRALTEPGALQLVAQEKVTVCLMHMSYPQGKPSVPMEDPLGEDVVASVKSFLQERVAACIAAGISPQHIVIDPGIGHGNFGKNLAQNLALLSRLAEFKTLNLPVLVGVSRKTFIGEILNVPVEDRLYGSLAAAAIAVNQGASIIRAHDVKATVEAVKVAFQLLQAQ